MYRILIFKNVQFQDIMPLLDGPEYLTLRLGDIVSKLNGVDGQWELVEVLTAKGF